MSTSLDRAVVSLSFPLLPLPPSIPLCPFLPPRPLQCTPWTLSANSAAPFFSSAASSSSSALFFISAASSRFASAAFPATSSTAASTPLSISPSSPASSSAPYSHSSSGFLDISANNRVFSSTSFIFLTSSTSFFDIELRANKRLDPFFSRQSQTQKSAPSHPAPISMHCQQAETQGGSASRPWRSHPRPAQHPLASSWPARSAPAHFPCQRWPRPARPCPERPSAPLAQPRAWAALQTMCWSDR